MKKVLGLAILASLVATPALAGETFVRNEWTKTNSATKTDLHLNSDTHSNRYEKYDSNADKIYVDGDVDFGKGGISFDKLSVHKASASLWGHYNEHNYTNVNGTIKTRAYSKSKAHETTSGVR